MRMFKNIKISLGKFFSKKKDKGPAFYPDRDWKILFLTFSAINLIMVISLLFFYLDLRKEKTIDSWENGSGLMSFNRELFHSTLEEYELKREKFELLSESESFDVSDPSII